MIKSTTLLLTIASVRFAAAQIPTMVVSPPSVTFTVPTGSVWSSDVPVSITSDGAKSISGLTRTIAYGAGQPTGWLKATLSGSGTPAILSFQVDATLLVPGTYDATVTVKSKLTGVVPQSIAVKLTVTNAPPAIAVARTATLTGTAGSLIPVDLKLDVTNGGGGKLTGLQSTVSYPSGEITGWLTAALGSPDAPTKVNLRATPIQSLLAGVHHATVVISAKDVPNSPQMVDVSFNVTGLNPAMQLTPSTVTFFGIIGTVDPAPQSVTISNVGGGTIEGLKRSTTYAPGEPSGWLKTSLGGTTLVLSPSTAALSPGVYTATVQVTSTTAYNSPQTVTVRFAVGNSPAHLTLTPTSHDFGAVGVGGASAAQAFTITNDGGLLSGPLTGPSGSFGGGGGLGGNNPGDFRLDPNSSCATVSGGLAPHTSCDFVFWFSPTAAGPRSAGLALGASPGGNVLAALSGTGTTEQVIVVTPPSHDFGTFGGGLPSSTQRFVLTNPLPWPTGPLQPISGPLGIPSPLIGGPNPGDFYVDPNSSCTQVLSTGLAVGGSCYFDVTFLPTGLGARSAVLAFQMTPGGVVQIAFSGNSLATGFLTITPTTKDFGSVGIGGASAAQAFTITNNAPIPSGPLTGPSGSFGGGGGLGGNNPGDFRPDPTSSCATVSGGLAPHTSCDIVLWFSPTAAGPRSAGLALGASPGGNVLAALSGTGTTAQVITVTPLAHDYGDVGLGVSSAAQRFVLTNPLPWPTGPMKPISGGFGVALGLAGPNPGDFYFDPNSSCAQVLSTGLPVGGSCYFDVSFIPLALGPRSATLVFQMTPGGVVQIPFSGNGVVAQFLSITPATYDFGTIGINSTTVPHRFTISNTGGVATGPFVTSGFQGTNPGDFAGVGSTSTCDDIAAVGLVAGGSCDLDITFTPANAGTRTASLAFGATPGGVASLSLSGTGTTDLRTSLLIAPTAVDFGGVFVGLASSAHRVTITNTGNTDFPVSGQVHVFGPGYQDFVPDVQCPSTLAPTASCNIDLTFNPKAQGSRTADLTIYYSDLTWTVPLSGTGLSTLAIAPAEHDFGRVVVGQTGAPTTFTLTNLGTAFDKVFGLEFSGLAPGDFSVADPTGSCGFLSPGDTCTLTVAFNPQGSGQRSAVLNVVTRSSASASAAVSGTGVAPVGNLAGTVRDLDSQPIAGAVVVLTGGGHFFLKNTTAQGAYEFLGIAPSGYALHVGPAGCSSEDANVAISAGDDLTHDIALDCPPRATGNITVVGVPSGDMAVQLTPVRGGTAVTAPVVNGRYDVAPPPDTYAITVTGLPTRCSASTAVNTLGSRQQEVMVTDLTVTCAAAIAIAPAPYDFGPLGLGQTRTVVLTATNQSDAPAPTGDFSWSSDYVTRYRVDFSSYNVADFDIDENGCYYPQILGPGQSCSVTIHFSPQAGGLRHAAFSTGGVTAQITGTGDVGIQLSVSPTPHDFGTLNLGATRTVLLTVTNNWVVATAPKVTEVTLGGTNASEFVRVPETGDCMQAGIAPGASCTLRVAFTPTSTGPKSASVTATFQSAVPGWLPGSTTATLTGTGSLEAMIFLSSSKDPSVAEDEVAFTALLRHPDGSSLSPMPVGLPITFVVSGQADKIVPLGSDGTASVKTSFKTAGAYPVSVSFADDNLGTGSNSLTQLVTPLPGDPTVGRVAGTIHDRDGQPVVGVTVFLIGATVPTPTTAADGSYEMNGIPPGKYTILATKGQFCVDLDSGEFSVTAQQTTTVSLTMNCPPLLYGAVTVTGPAPSALTVQASPVRGGASFSGPVQSDGTYSMFIGAAEYNVAAVGPLRCRSSVEGIEGVHQQDLVTADLTVTCTNERFRITPVSYDFGGVLWGQQSSPATFTVTNVTEQAIPAFSNYGVGGTGPSVLNCSGLNCNFNDRTYLFASSSGDCGFPLSLAAGASCSVTVQFSPLLPGVQNGTIGVCLFCGVDDLRTWIVQATLTGHGRDAEATLALSPGSFDFGAVQVNTSSKAKQFVAVNTGPDPSGPISVSLTGADAADFGLASKCQDATLAGNSSASCNVDVTFTPHGFGPRTATVTITGTPGGTASATLTGTGDGLLTLAPTAKDFGSVAVGQSGTPVAFTVTNAGTTDVLINHFETSGPNFNDFVVDPGSCGPALVPTGSCTLTVRFTPKATGVRAATLTASGTGGAPTVSASLTGTGGAVPVIAFTPASFDFGNRQVNFGSGGVFFFTVTNGGSTATPLLDHIEITGAAAADFFVDAGDNRCNGVSLAPGASCTLSVGFLPHALGLRSATVTLSAATGGASASAQVTGTGVAPAVLAVTPPSKDFGTVNLGQTSPQFTFTLTNTGPSPGGLIVTDSLTGLGRNDYVFGPNQCFSIAVDVGTSCQFTVSFSPKAGGSRPATYVMVFQGGTATVNFTGAGTSPNALLTVAPDSQDFGLAFLGASSETKTVTVTNVGHTTSGSLVNFSLTGPGAYEFGILNGSNNCNARTLAPAASCTIGLIFTPQIFGQRAATLAISDGGVTGTVKLTGTGEAATIIVLTIAPDTFRFGSVLVGQTSAPATFTVTNPLPFSTGAINSFALTGVNTADYHVSQGTCAGAALDPGGTCTFSVTFAPQVGGGHPSTLTVKTAAGEAGATQLRGSGVAPTVLAVTPDSQDFGFVFVGAISPPVTFTVTNAGGGVPAVLDFAFTGTNASEFGFLDTSSCHKLLVLAPGASCTFDIIFGPSAYGPRSAHLALSNIAVNGGSVTIALTGGTTPGGALTIAPTSKNFGTIPVGFLTLPEQFTVANTGTTIAFLSGVFLDDPAGYDYALAPGTLCAGGFLTVGASCDILVYFVPQRTGPLPATLRVVYDQGTVSASLMGTGGPPSPTPTVGAGGTMELTAFTATDAARDLLGVPTLTAAHRAYLDGTGNHNGTYDLGDLLAFFDRHDIKLSPALLASPDSKERAP